MTYTTPHDREVQRVMADHGWDRMTAERHVAQRRTISERLARERALAAAECVRRFHSRSPV